MTPQSFIARIGRNNSWKPVSLESIDDWIRKLYRFTPDQLDDLWDGVLEQCHFTPSIASIFRIATEKGYMKNLREETSAHVEDRWEETKCRWCGGYGVVSTFCRPDSSIPELWGPLKGEGRLPHAKTWNLNEHLSRCPCGASERETFPIGLKPLPVFDESKYGEPVF